MELNEIKELLDQGFTPEQIVSLSTNLRQVKGIEPVAPKEEAPAAPKPTDEINLLKNEIKELRTTIQASNILKDTITNLPKPEDPSDILAKVLYGEDPNKK